MPDFALQSGTENQIEGWPGQQKDFFWGSLKAKE